MIISTTPSDNAIEEQDSELGEQTQTREFTVQAEQHGQRVDRTLSELIPELSRSYLQQLVIEGCLKINARRVDKPSSKVLAGQTLTMELRPTEQSQAFKPEPMSLNIVYQDEDLLVINKDAGMVVHPAAGNWSGTLLNGLLALHEAHMRLPRAGIVHRLDKDTSGLMVVARRREVMDQLVQMIAARQVKREYLALAHRNWVRQPSVSATQAIGRDPRNRLRMAVVDLDKQAGKTACTHFELLQSTAAEGGVCLVRAKLETGRTHQIRVHLSHMGHPLIGDELYGGKPQCGMQRQALHAQRLSFEHPVSGQFLEFVAPLPADMRDALQTLGWATIPTS